MPRRHRTRSNGGLALVTVLGLVLSLAKASPTSADGSGAEPVIGPAAGRELHVMSFNLRYASDRSPHSWAQRRPAMAELLRRERPTLLGTQEGLHGQLQDVAEDLPPHYDWIGIGREGGTRSEYTAVFYDAQRLRPLESGHFWLSDTPDVVGSRSWGNAVVRMVTWVRFLDTRTGREFAHLNAHFDHGSENSRVRGAQLVRSRVGALPPDLPVVLTGDFNASAGASRAYDVLVAEGGLTDTWPAAAERRSAAYATYHGYGPLVADGPRIDWILVRGAVGVRAAAINPFTAHGRHPSDHLPVQALITLTT